MLLVSALNAVHMGIGSENGTPAHQVVKHDFASPYIFKEFLENGFNPNSRDSQSRTVLHCLFEKFDRSVEGNSKISDLLLLKG